MNSTHVHRILVGPETEGVATKFTEMHRTRAKMNVKKYRNSSEISAQLCSALDAPTALRAPARLRQVPLLLRPRAIAAFPARLRQLPLLLRPRATAACSCSSAASAPHASSSLPRLRAPARLRQVPLVLVLRLRLLAWPHMALIPSRLKI